MATGFCILAGNDLDIKEGDCTMEFVPVGAIQRMFDGTAKSSIRAVKREATVRVALLTPTLEAALRTAMGNGATAVTWTGAILSGASVQAFVEFKETSYIGDGTTHKREPQLVIREI